MRRRLPTGDKSDYFCPLMKKFMQNRVYLLDYSSLLSAPCDNSYVARLRLLYVSPTSTCRIFTGIYIRLHGYVVQPFGLSLAFKDYLLWLLLTSHSSLLLRLMVPPVRPHGISPCSFLVYPPDLRSWVTATFRALLHFASLPTISALLSGFCP